MGNSMTHGSLFSGIGAAEIAAEMLGWENVFHCEINPFGRQVLDYWFPNSASYGDITKTDFSKYRGKIDVLTGGFPCQPFSYAGKRGGQDDDRYLWHEMLRVIEEVRPTWVVGENVNGITTMVESYSVTEVGGESTLFDEGNTIHRYESEQTFTIERICRDLESKGYSVQPMLIPACAIGAPHRRDRIFILAYNVADTDCGNELRDTCDIRQRDKGKERMESTDTDCRGLERAEEGRGERRRVNVEWNSGILLPERRWKAFPSVSPVHRGNDGLPFDVDNLTIPASKWRIESIKAYGNAIVPQVIYQIFKCINELN